MILRFASCSLSATLLVALTSAQCDAGSVTDWRTYRGTAATTLAGQGSDDPGVGDNASPASTAFVIGHLDTPAVLGPNVGDFVKLSFGVSFTDENGMNNAGDNFRFALFDLNGEAPDSATGGDSGGPNYATAGTDNTDQFRGYVIGARNGSATGSAGSIRERIADLASGNNAFAVSGANNATAPSLGSIGGDSVTLASDGAIYRGNLTLTRTAIGVDLTGSFIGSNGTTGNTFSVSDNAAPSSSTFGAVGFLIGGPLGVDQVNFRNVRVSVPEPASLLLLMCGIAGVLLSRQRA